MVCIITALILASHLVNLIADHISHLLLLFVNLDFDLSAELLLLKTIEVTDDFKSGLKDDGCN